MLLSTFYTVDYPSRRKIELGYGTILRLLFYYDNINFIGCDDSIDKKF